MDKNEKEKKVKRAESLRLGRPRVPWPQEKGSDAQAWSNPRAEAFFLFS